MKQALKRFSDSLEQIRTIDKGRLKEKVCHLRLDIMEEVDRALGISVGLSSDSAPAKQIQLHKER